MNGTKRRSVSPVSPDDNGAYTFHPVKNSDIDKPSRDRPHCRVLLLDGVYHTIPVDKKAKAIVVINELFRHLDLKDLQEKEFFSVYYIDTSGSKIFLNPFKQIRKQLPNISGRTTWDLFFGVQFYATEISMLADEMTRYLYVLQMCRDIKEKRIKADNSTKIQLVGLLVQANCGDYDPEEHKEGYVEPYIDMIYNPADIPFGLRNSVSEVHKEKTGFKPDEADDAFFTIVKSLYKFGQQLFPVRDRLGQSGEVGASLVGLFFHKDGREFMNIPWGDVVTVGYRKKKIRVRYHPKGSNDDVEEMLYLYCTQPHAKLVWRGCVEQHTFFRLERPIPLVKNTVKSYHSFNRNSELRFSTGRTLYQMLRSQRKQQQNFQRSLSLHIKDRNKDNEEISITVDLKEPEPKAEKSPTPIPSDEPEPNNDRKSIESETLQRKIEDALKKMSEEQLHTTDDDPQTGLESVDASTIAVEINHSDGNENKSGGEEEHQEEQEEKEDTDVESSTPTVVECQGNLSLGLQMHVEITKSNTDLTDVDVEFSSADKNNSSFMVTLEETTPSPPPADVPNGFVIEGKVRSDSILTNDLGPAAHYLLEKANMDDGTVTATAVDIEVRTPSPTNNETNVELIEQELNKANHFETSPENDFQITVNAENF